MKKLFIASIIIAGTMAACKGHKTTVAEKKTDPLGCASKSISYAVDIKPVMEQFCTKCHNTNEKAGYNFLQLESVKKAADNGHLLGTIKQQEGFAPMPPRSAKLDQAVIDKIECWIYNGMKE